MSEETTSRHLPRVDSAFIELAIEMAGLDGEAGEDGAVRTAGAIMEEAAKIHRTIEG